MVYEEETEILSKWYKDYGITDHYFADDNVCIVCADCREVLPRIPDKSIDLGVTSPPFNLGNTHHTGSHRHNAYGDNLPEAEYQSVQAAILTDIYRVITDDGSFWYQHKNRIKDGVSTSPYLWLFRTPWLVKQEIVWRNRSQNFDKIRFYPMTERLYWLAKSPKTKLTNIVNMHDDWHIEPVGSRGEHTRAFPEKIVSNIISCFPAATVVLDPFLGSGTTIVVADRLNRKCIGIEVTERYCEIATIRYLRSKIE